MTTRTSSQIDTTKTVITVGRVLVCTPEYDCEGGQKYIAFPHTGKILYGTPICDFASKRFLAQARIVAKKALEKHVKDRGRIQNCGQ